MKSRQAVIPSPKNIIFLSPILILFVSLISALFNNQKTFSLVGYGFEIGTFSFLFLFFSVFFLTILIFPFYKSSNSKSIFLIVLSFIILAIFHFSRFIFGEDFLSLGIFPLKTDTPIGSWNELSFFSGALFFISVFFLDRTNNEGRARGNILFLVTFFFSLVLMVVVNYWMAWLLVFSVLILFTFFQFFRQSEIIKSKKNEKEKHFDEILPKPKFEKKFLTFSVPAIFITLIFVLPLGGFFSNYINKSLSISYLDVKPSWASTYNVFSETLKEDPKMFFFGSGPNTFLTQWRKWKPIEINQSSFWDTEFHQGAGLIPTFFVTTGFLGFLFWLLFILSFFWFGIRYIIKNPKETFSPLFLFLSFYFWVTAFIYPVSHSLFIFTAFFMGLFIASAVKSKLPFLKFSPDSKPISNMTLLLVLILFLTISLFSSFVFFRKTLSALNLNDGISLFLEGKTVLAEDKLLKAQNISSNDVISRYLSEIYLIESRELAETVDEPTSEDIFNFQNILESSKSYAELAVITNPKSFENWFQLARFYEFIQDISPEQSEESADSARMSYEGALRFDPKNPLIDLMQARLEFSVGNLDKAEEFAKKSLSKKSNYSEAIFLLSQIEATRGNLEEAIESAKGAVSLSPNEASVYFQLGLLLYQNEDIEDAIGVFNKALLIEPKYSNARYFLGLSLAKVGDSFNATKQFEILSKSNPEDKNVSEILSNLKKNQDLFESDLIEESLESIPLIEAQ